jgi:5-carboxymethyl-2-hydroxymuconate isomerase
MPHAVVEWTDNLEGQADIRGLLELIAAELRDSGGAFPVGGIRVRGVRLSDYVIADGAADDAFINITIKIGAGRPAEFKRAFFSAMFDKIKLKLEDLQSRRYLALSLYVEEFEEAGGYKHNNIHDRFRKPV